MRLECEELAKLQTYLEKKGFNEREKKYRVKNVEGEGYKRNGY